MSTSMARAAERRRLGRRVTVLILATSGVTDVVGAAAVFAFIAWVLPGDAISGADQGRLLLINGVLVALWVPIVLVIGGLRVHQMMRPMRRWLAEVRPPTAREARTVLRTPVRVFRVQLGLWVVSGLTFAVANGLHEPRLFSRIALTVVLGGISTSAIVYLTTERLMRPLATLALAEAEGPPPRMPGVMSRQLLAWGLGTAVPLLGLLVSGIFALVEEDSSRQALALTMITTSGVALAVGLWVVLLGARAVADPVRAVHRGMSQVEAGDLDASVAVWDASELGLLQDGFNRMVEGLREREHIRELFGRQVGEDVAREALEGDPELGGQVAHAAVLFVDMVASTRLAASCPPHEVVELLNRFFQVVVEVVADHGGWINKFQGDAALAVFGVPGERADPAGSALSAGRHLMERLARDVPEVRAGIGIVAGEVVAGNIGAEERFEYTVIGDPVNAAARLSELAKARHCWVLSNAETVAAADPTEARRWHDVGRETLRGRLAPTELQAPLEVVAAPNPLIPDAGTDGWLVPLAEAAPTRAVAPDAGDQAGP